jgi:hypothetical protein
MGIYEEDTWTPIPARNHKESQQTKKNQLSPKGPSSSSMPLVSSRCAHQRKAKPTLIPSQIRDQQKQHRISAL